MDGYFIDPRCVLYTDLWYTFCCVLQESRRVQSAPSVKMTGRCGQPSHCCTCSVPSSPSQWLSWDTKVS